MSLFLVNAKFLFNTCGKWERKRRETIEKESKECVEILEKDGWLIETESCFIFIYLFFFSFLLEIGNPLPN
jgi:hypothetical protein